MKKINIALAGHTSVGKTTFTDTLLYNIGSTDTLGRVDDGKSLSDFDEEEIKRKISIHYRHNTLWWEKCIQPTRETRRKSIIPGKLKLGRINKEQRGIWSE